MKSVGLSTLSRVYNSSFLAPRYSLTSLAKSLSTKAKPTIAIRREDASVWERRAPLTPSHVRKLVRQGIDVAVQPSNRRAFSLKEYKQAGARIQEDIDAVPVHFSVKAPRNELLQPNKTYVYFSHTIKAQKPNMPMLDIVLNKKIRMIDYEKMVDDNGQRLVAFGTYAGMAGIINILHGLGLRLLALGHHTPFMNIGPPHTYKNVNNARQAIREAGYEIALGHLPASIGPLIFVFTGAGNVSQGAQEIFFDLPYEMITVDQLPKIASCGETTKLYGCVVDRKDHVYRRDGGPFDFNESLAKPHLYISNFSTKVAPYMSVMLNGVLWYPGDHRLLTFEDARHLLSTPPLNNGKDTGVRSEGMPTLPHRLIGICDVSADPGGSIEFMSRCTSIDMPFELFDPAAPPGTEAMKAIASENFQGPGVLICSIDNMPTQLPRESSDFFGTRLLPFVPDIASSDAYASFESWKVSRIVKDATITSNGQLTPSFKYIAKMRREREEQEKLEATKQSISVKAKNRVLLLGSGYVSGPVIDYLTRDTNTAVTIASDLKEQADILASRYPNTNVVHLDIEKDSDNLRTLVQNHKLVISLLPYKFHPSVLKFCIAEKKHMVTASYVSPALRELESAAKEAGIMCVNEMGLDPGIDHMHAMEMIHACREGKFGEGARVTAFESWCGGLPAPEHSENALRYKFSWSPEGVLLAANSGARWMWDKQTKEIPQGQLMQNAHHISLLPGFNLEGIPNRDSLTYADLYGIKDSIQTMLRGTLRYQGYCDALWAFQRVGLLSDKPHPKLAKGSEGEDLSWPQLLAILLESSGPRELRASLQERLRSGSSGTLVEQRVKQALLAFEQLGLFNERQKVERRGNPLSTLAFLLNRLLAYGANERDLVILTHRVEVTSERGQRTEHERRLIVYGDAGAFSPSGTPSSPAGSPTKAKPYSAMAKTVGYPVAIASRLLLEGRFDELPDGSRRSGIVIPLTPDIYAPILTALELEGLRAEERVTRLD